MCDSVYISLLSGLSLSEYVEARSMYCLHTHKRPCKCENLLNVAGIVLQQNYCSLAQAFAVAAPGKKYTERARSVLLQMPLVSIRIGDPYQGKSFSFLMEKFIGTDYRKLGAIINSLAVHSHVPKGVSLEKSMVKMLLRIAQSDRERESMRYVIYKASGMTASQARRAYGFQNMQSRALAVEDAIAEIQQIREAIEDLANVEEEALLTRWGIPVAMDTSSSESEDEEEVTQVVWQTLLWSSDSEVDNADSLVHAMNPASEKDLFGSLPTRHADGTPSLRSRVAGVDLQDSGTPSLLTCVAGVDGVDVQDNGTSSFPSSWKDTFGSRWPEDLDSEELKVLLAQSKYNWFEVMEKLESRLEGDISNKVESLFAKVSTLGIEPKALHAIEQSYLAFHTAEKEQYEQDHTARALNGEVVSDAESDDPHAYTGITDPLSSAGKEIIAKKRATIRRRMKRRQAKAIAERRYLSRKLSKRTCKILRECPDIGKEIESFVQSHNVGADAWRRTGVLTFDGNVRVKEKVTYERIRKHLQIMYQRKISYGTVIQLCCPRNKRRRSAKYYRGVAKVTSRHARKGFSLKYNPDALYKGLNGIQYKDGRDILSINRDDATGFRLDTLTTCKQYRTPVVQGKEVLTTRTDYVNKYPSVLQTTSYNFTATSTTEEVCVGVVKAPKVHQKNPAQHAADIELLEASAQLNVVFMNADTGAPKAFECVRVDGASDEGPSHEEVQFWWTARHISKGRHVTLVTTRSSGSSYLNRVELQNGCLSLGHASTFIPSTLGGCCEDPVTGAIDQEKLCHNLDLAADVYISRVNGCPCGDTIIHLFKGAQESEQLRCRDKLLVFLKGSKQAKGSLQKEDPNLYSYFQSVWDVRNSHTVKGLPPQYFLMLLCCYQSGCQHPQCRKGRPTTPLVWYSGGPSITKLPLPKTDPERPWGGQCQTCSGPCYGHYACKLVDVTDHDALSNTAPPPSSIIKRKFSKSPCDLGSESFIAEVAREALLPPEEAKIWLTHLQTVLANRKRGAAKAAATRAKKRASAKAAQRANNISEYFCGTCKREYAEETEESELWIGCDICDRWYCGECENLQVAPNVDTYICTACQQ